MASKDLRKAQLGLLRFEKTLIDTARQRKRTGVLNKAALVAGFTGVMTAAAEASDKLGSAAPLEHAAAIKSALESDVSSDSWLTHLAEVVSAGHAAIEGMAAAGAHRLIERYADGGLPKDPVVRAVSSILGLG